MLRARYRPRFSRLAIASAAVQRKMRRLRQRRPTPAMAVAFIALLAALSGGTAIALPGKNTVDSGDVKRNSLRSGDVRNNSLRGIDVRNDTLTGTDVNESSLGKVPSATNADNAANAANATNAANAQNAASAGGFRVARVDAFTLTDNQAKEILKEGPLTFTATCRINFDDDANGATPNIDRARINIATTADNASFDGNDTGADLDVATPEDDRQFVEVIGDPTGTPNIDDESDGTALATDGTEIIDAELYAAVNVLNQPGVCRFGGFFMIG